MIGAMPDHSRLGRALLGLAAALALVAVLLTVQGLRRHPQHRVSLVAGPPAVAVDPAGCPIGAGCRAGATAPPAMLAAIFRVFPNGVLAGVTGVSEAATGRPFRVVVRVLLDPSATLTLTAQRLPGGPSNDPAIAESSIRSHTDLSGNLLIDSTEQRLISAGRPGCSVSIEVTAPPDYRFLDPLAQRLSADPAVQLTP
jgi:hypothetical protein